MNFQDTGIIISKKPIGEEGYIISILSKNHGICKGIVKDSQNKIKSYQSHGPKMIANLVDFSWRARLKEHIGYLKCENIKSYGVILMQDKIKLYAFNSIISLINLIFYERENICNFFDIFAQYLNDLSRSFNIKQYIDLELNMLAKSGYGLDLTKCAVTSKTEDLLYVSPKSGKAICKTIGAPFNNKLLKFPNIIKDCTAVADNIKSKKYSEVFVINEVQDAFNLTGYFFSRYFKSKQDQFKARDLLVELCTQIPLKVGYEI